MYINPHFSLMDCADAKVSALCVRDERNEGRAAGMPNSNRERHEASGDGGSGSLVLSQTKLGTIRARRM
jgi:hypothetical protein